jgi:hypothetical protein
MKKIVRGNDFHVRIPVKKIVNGEQVSFPLTDCTDIAVHVVSKYKRTALPYTIDKESNDVLLADVDGTTLSLGTYALEVTGVSEGANWRSFEYEQFAIVDNNASSDTVFEDNTADGDTNIEDGNGDNANKGCMDVKIEGFAVDTALVVLPPVSSRTTSSVKKSKPKIEYVVGRAIKCSLLTLSSSDRVRYIVPNNDKMISLLVGNKTSSLLAKKGDSIKVKFIINGPIPLLGWVEPVRTHYYSVSPGRNDEIEITKVSDVYTCFRVSLYINVPNSGAWFVKNVTLSKDGVYVVTLDSKGIPSSFDTVSPYRKFEKGMVVNKRLPQSLNFNAGSLDEFSAKQGIYLYKYTWCRTKRLKQGVRLKVKKMRRKFIKFGICNIVAKHQNEKKSCYMQTYAVNIKRKQIKRLS